MKIQLKDLIGTDNQSIFFECLKSNSPIMFKMNDAVFNNISSLPFLTSLDALINSWPHHINAHLPDARDEISSIETTTKDAHKFFQNGMGLLFNEAQTISPQLNEWVNQVRIDLGFSNLTNARNLIYATPDKKGTATHFDQNINLVIQIHGTKIWKIAKNDSVSNPLTRHTLGQTMDNELASYLENELPCDMPNNFETFELKAGSILFVPRGSWHSTVADGDALALNFTYSAPTWIDIFSTALRSRLSGSSVWRETVTGLNTPDGYELALEKMEELMSELCRDAIFWNANNILEVTEYSEN